MFTLLSSSSESPILEVASLHIKKFLGRLAVSMQVNSSLHTMSKLHLFFFGELSRPTGSFNFTTQKLRNPQNLLQAHGSCQIFVVV